MRSEYVLISSVKNEEEYIEDPLRSVTKQTVLPQRWIIVSDGSTDGTERIVRRFQAQHRFIELLSIPPRASRSFASKAWALNWAYSRLKDREFRYIGNLDGDISFESEYYEKLLQRFDENSRLGIATGMIFDYSHGKTRKVTTGLHHPTGAIQLFRRKCFEDIGGYVPLRTGGIDSVAAITARMKGWETCKFKDLVLLHHRAVGAGGHSGMIRARFREGITEYHLGTDPLIALLKAVQRVKEKPALLSSILRFCGFLKAWTLKEKREVSKEFVDFVRKEGRANLLGLLTTRKFSESTG